MKSKILMGIACISLLFSACKKSEDQALVSVTNAVVKEPNKQKRGPQVYGVRPLAIGSNQSVLVEISYPTITPIGLLTFTNTQPVPNITGIAQHGGMGYVLYRTAVGTNWLITEFPITNPGACVLYRTILNSFPRTNLCDIEIGGLSGNNEFYILDRSNATSGNYFTGRAPLTPGSQPVSFVPVNPAPFPVPAPAIQHLQGICTWQNNCLILANDFTQYVRLNPNLTTAAIMPIPYGGPANISWAHCPMPGAVGSNDIIIFTRGNLLTQVSWLNFSTGTGALTTTYNTSTGEIFDLAKS